MAPVSIWRKAARRRMLHVVNTHLAEPAQCRVIIERCCGGQPRCDERPQLALSWLALQAADVNCAEQAKQGPVPRRWQDYRDASERRYLTALKLLQSIPRLPKAHTPR